MERVGIVAILSITAITIFGVWAIHDTAEHESSRCNAARQTIVEESDLIAAAGKFPSEAVTTRWKDLMGGC